MTATHPRQQTHIPSVHDYDTLRHNNALMIHAFLLFPMHSIHHVSHLYVFTPSSQLTWLADPALVTMVYPNWMQYMPRVLQEASLLDGVDAGVHGNSRRFSKTSSYPPCHCYAFTPFILIFSQCHRPFVLDDSFLSHNPPYPVLPYKFFSHSL